MSDVNKIPYIFIDEEAFDVVFAEKKRSLMSTHTKVVETERSIEFPWSLEETHTTP